MLNAGNYYIGDLSVVLSPEEVMHVSQFPDGYCSLPDGTTIAKFAIPNGVYRTSLGNHLSVSIGTIGIIPRRDTWSRNDYVVNINKFGMLHNFYEQFAVTNDRGDIQFGTVVIDANNDGYLSTGGELAEVVNNKEFMDNLKDVERVNQI